MSVIDPERHADLIALQQAVFAATDELYAYTGDHAEPLREAARQAAAAKEAALHGSGLVAEHGYDTANVALKQAAKS